MHCLQLIPRLPTSLSAVSSTMAIRSNRSNVPWGHVRAHLGGPAGLGALQRVIRQVDSGRSRFHTPGHLGRAPPRSRRRTVPDVGSSADPPHAKHRVGRRPCEGGDPDGFTLISAIGNRKGAKPFVRARRWRRFAQGVVLRPAGAIDGHMPALAVGQYLSALCLRQWRVDKPRTRQEASVVLDARCSQHAPPQEPVRAG
jgi:hypothetical protein